MLTAESYLNIIQDRGKRKLPLDDVYRQLFNPDMYLQAYTKLYKNQGAMTPGTMGETVDGMSFEKIGRIIEAIRYERWKWPPARRVYITDGVSRLQTNKFDSTCWPSCHGHALPPSWLKACNPVRNGGVYDHHHRFDHGLILSGR